MKITYLHQYFVTPDQPGGHRSFELARRLVERGHEVHMVTGDMSATKSGLRWRATNEAGIHVHWAPVPYGNHMTFGRRIAAFLHFAAAASTRAAMLGGDVMFATSTPLTIAIPALIASSVRQIPFVFEVRDMWPDVPIALGALRHPILQTFARQLELLTYRRAAHVVALAPGMREDIVAKGIPAGKVSVIPNGCDIHAFGGAAEGRSPRNDFEWLGTRKLVLCAGTIGRVHGVDYMVHLARIVGRIDPEVRFVAIGGGAEWERIRSLAASEGVLDRNFFIFRPVGQRVLAGWLHAADLSLALIGGPRIVWKDAVQNKFFDALAAGKPIASNFDGWQSQVAQEADVGITLDRDDIERSASQVLAVLADDAWRSGVPERARRLAEGAFSRDRHALELEAIFARVVNRVAPVAKSG